VGSFGTVALKDVWSMLEQCAPGHTRKQTPHNWRITYRGQVYPSFPLGPHGKRVNPPIEIGHIKKMARMLGILDCAKSVLPQLG
jgi:hypothetical protein